MQPNQQQNPYDFIMNPGQPAKKPLFSFGGKKGGKLAMIVVGGVSLVVILFLALSLLTGNKTSNKELLALAQEQQEIIRVAGLGKKARSQDAINLAANTTALIGSSQQQTIALLGKKDKPNAKELALNKNLKTDQTLVRAEQTNQFDEQFVSLLQKQIAAYQKNVKTAYDKSSAKKPKTVLKQAYANASALLKSETVSSQEPN